MELACGSFSMAGWPFPLRELATFTSLREAGMFLLRGVDGQGMPARLARQHGTMGKAAEGA